MNAAKQDPSSLFRPIQLTINSERRTLPKNSVHVSGSGITFSSAKYMAPFTEVRVKVQLPRAGAPAQAVDCVGMVVDCQGNKFSNQYRVAVAFVNIPKTVENELRQAYNSSRKPSLTAATKIG